MKSNRIFKVVSISGSYIQPFSIVWIPDNNLIRNKVIVLFSYPINSENRSVDELSEMWKSAEERGIRAAKEFIDSLMQIEAGDLNRREKRKLVREKLRELRKL